MTTQVDTAVPAIAGHGARQLTAVVVDSYNVEIKDEDGFVGDRANKGAFRGTLDHWRKLLKKDSDPFAGKDSEELSKKQIETALLEGEPKAAGLVVSAIEDFSQDFASVIKRVLKLKDWRDTERIAVGGGFRDTRIGEIVIGRTNLILKAAKIDLELVPIRHDPDDAGLIGALHLAPSWMFKGHDAILAADIGGTNIRVGVVELAVKKAADLSKARVWKSELWRHADESRLSREKAVQRMAEMLKGIIAAAQKAKLDVAPFIGIGCPGIIEEDGSIDRGVQNLPGDWAHKEFHLPSALKAEIPEIGKHETSVLLHNDAVVQGLSQLPFMHDVEHWGVMTIGTGLGNARFTNRSNGKSKTSRA
jgi:predicted NBD/HSP70 family sugar kinase